MKLTAEIELNNGMMAIVDAEDVPAISEFSWRVRENHGNLYARANSNNRSILMHRLILGAKPGQIVDHINRNGLDNRRENLRFATRRQNFANSQARGRHPWKGICFDKRCKSRPWQAVIKINGRNKTAGFYATAQEAARAYDRMAWAEYGEFAYLNFPDALDKERG